MSLPAVKDNWTSFCIIFVLLHIQFSITWYTARNFLFWFPRLLLWFPAASFGPNWWAICSVHEHHAGPVGEQVDGREDNAGRVPSPMEAIVTQTHLAPHHLPLKPSLADLDKERPKGGWAYHHEQLSCGGDFSKLDLIKIYRLHPSGKFPQWWWMENMCKHCW